MGVALLSTKFHEKAEFEQDMDKPERKQKISCLSVSGSLVLFTFQRVGSDVREKPLGQCVLLRPSFSAFSPKPNEMIWLTGISMLSRICNETYRWESLANDQRSRTEMVSKTKAAKYLCTKLQFSL